MNLLEMFKKLSEEEKYELVKMLNDVLIKDGIIAVGNEPNMYTSQFATKCEIEMKKEENKSLEDLKQKLLNGLYEKEIYDETDIKILCLLILS